MLLFLFSWHLCTHFGVLTPLLLKPFQRVIDERENKTDGARAEVERLKDLGQDQTLQRAWPIHAPPRAVSETLCGQRAVRKKSELLATLAPKFSKH